jgi:plasmid stability protein
MAQVLVRNLDGKTVKALKRRADLHHRSLQEELRTILERNAQEPLADHLAAADRIRKRLRRYGLTFSDSGQDQAEDRLR